MALATTLRALCASNKLLYHLFQTKLDSSFQYLECLLTWNSGSGIRDAITFKSAHILPLRGLGIGLFCILEDFVDSSVELDGAIG